MSIVAAIIKHPFRDRDWRVDLIEIPPTVSLKQAEDWVQRQMLGPFQVIALTTRVNLQAKHYQNPPDCTSDFELPAVIQS